jgi:flagellar L-ring protein precursor FlgH
MIRRNPLHCRPAPALAVLAALLVTGCGNTLNRLAEVGETPPMTHIQNPTQSPGYRPVSMPMPAPTAEQRQPNSLWRTGARSFFKDQRAAQVGDLLTVLITIEDKAELTNTSERSRANTDDASVNALLGYESSLNRVLPEAINPGNLVDIDSATSNNGSGSINRNEKIDLKIAAVITQRLPNGNLVVQGRQEVRVNYEVRQLQIAGIVRREDITADNTISYDKIAEARIAYGGRGQITDVQQPRYGSQILDVLFPF